MIPLIIISIVLLIFFSLTWFIKPSPKTKLYRAITAGGVDDSIPSECIVKRRDVSAMNLVFAGDPIDPADFDIFVVYGNSMKMANINNKDLILVRQLFGREKYQIEATPVLVFEIDRSMEDGVCKDCSVEFKLRKFISYVNVTTSFPEWFGNLKNKRDDLKEKEDFISNAFSTCVKKYEKMDKTNSHDFQLIFSETLKEGELTYSFHPMKLLYGKVEYVIDHRKMPQ